MRIVFATGNKDKMREIRQILGGIDAEVLSMKEAGVFEDVVEDGTTFSENARIKADAIYKLLQEKEPEQAAQTVVLADDSGLEIDFVMRYKGGCTLVEVKSTTGDAKSVRTILKHPEKYHVKEAIKLGDYNIGRSGNQLTLPLYLAFLLRQY